MIELESLQAAITSLAGAGTLVRAMINVRDATVVNGKLSELASTLLEAQGHALSAQALVSALQRRVSELEKQLMDMQNWDAEKARYALHERGFGAFTYALKEGERGTDPAHELCAHCYQRGIKSILQYERSQAPGRPEWLSCKACGAEILVGGFRGK